MIHEKETEMDTEMIDLADTKMIDEKDTETIDETSPGTPDGKRGFDPGALENALRALRPDDMNWTFALYSAARGRDGAELTWSACDMKGAASWTEKLRKAFLVKTLEDKTVAEYSPFLSDKEFIAALRKDSDVIKDQISDIELNIKNSVVLAPEDFMSGAAPKPTGYAFYGELKSARAGDGEVARADGEEIANAGGTVLFMRRGNPFVAGANARLCTTEGGTIVDADRPILKFTTAVDFIMIDGACYFNSSGIEKDFDLASRSFAIASKRLSKIAASEIIGDYERLEETALTPGNARKFADFDGEILDRILRAGVVEREEFLAEYGITLDKSGRMDTGDQESCELVIDLLCRRSVIDPLGRLSAGVKITPRM